MKMEEILVAAARKLKEDNEKLRTMLRAALETAWGPEWETEARRIANGPEAQTDPRDGGGDRRE